MLAALQDHFRPGISPGHDVRAPPVAFFVVVDHILLDVISAFRESLEGALLEQQAVEERFQVDVFLGDVSFETSYSLPGEQQPPRVRVDIGLEWPTWSQSAYRSWSIGEPPSEQPEVVVEVTLRLQRLAVAPDRTAVLSVLGNTGPSIAGEPLSRGGVTVEHGYDDDEAAPSFALDITYQGALKLTEPLLEEPNRLDDQLRPLGGWVASALVRLADLDLPFLPTGGPGASA